MAKSSRKGWRRGLYVLVVSILTFLFATILSQTGPFRTLELKFLDTLFELRGPLSTEHSPVILVAISDQADKELPTKFPYPTNYYARLVENLSKAGAKAIVFDVIITKNDIYDLRNDTLFAQAMAKYKNVILAGKIVNERVGNNATTQRLDTPLPLYNRYNPNPWGFVSIIPDDDGFFRRYLLRERYLGKDYFPIGLEAIRLYRGWNSVDLEETDSFFRFGDYIIPKSGGNTMQINYYGDRNSFKEFSMDLILDDADFHLVSEDPDDPDGQINSFDDPDFGLLYTDEFKDKIILVGATKVELHDLYPTPFSGYRLMPGYEGHANAIQTILDQNYIRVNPPLTDFLVILGASVLIALTTILLPAGFSVVVMIMMLFGYVYFVYYSFIYMNYWHVTTGVSIAIIFGYLGTVVYEYLSEQVEKRRIKDMFSSYVSPELVTKMIETGEDPKLGGSESEITAFFSDIQGFSTFSEKLTPTQLVDLINEYLTAMTDILTEEGGTLDKYIGDAIVAFFGAPVHTPDHAKRGCDTAARMLKMQGQLRDKWRAEGDKWPSIVSEMQTRIGLNTGSMVTGNMGSGKRFNYTMMGDNVNLAARCESGAKAYGVYIMITEETKNQAQAHGSHCIFRYLDKIVVKGRTLPVVMYELMGFEEDLPPETKDCIRIYEEGIALYLNKKWDEAKAKFEESAKIEPFREELNPGSHTTPSLVMIERCEYMKAHPPEGEWNGVYVMKTK